VIPWIIYYFFLSSLRYFKVRLRRWCSSRYREKEIIQEQLQATQVHVTGDGFVLTGLIEKDELANPNQTTLLSTTRNVVGT
jgi:hypothetical protein